MSVKLYGFLLCPYVHRVRFALESLQIPYEYIEVDLFRNKHLEEEYLKVNPLGYVPSISFNNETIYESLVLLEFLGEQFGSILPKDPVKRAQSRIWANYYDQNVISNIWEIFSLAKSKDEEGIQKLANKLAEEIRFWTKNSKLSEKVKQNPKTFFDGDNLSYVDFAVIPHTRYLETFYQIIFNKSLFDLVENDDLIKEFRVYLNNVASTEAYQRITTKLTLPPQGDNQILDTLNFTKETYNYETFLKTYINKKFES